PANTEGSGDAYKQLKSAKTRAVKELLLFCGEEVAFRETEEHDVMSFLISRTLEEDVSPHQVFVWAEGAVVILRDVEPSVVRPEGPMTCHGLEEMAGQSLTSASPMGHEDIRLTGWGHPC